MIGRASDLFTINLGTLRRFKLPVPIDSSRWERGPRISNAFSLFARDASLRTTLLLLDRSTKTMEKLVSLDLTRYYTVPGAVGERYATWSVCGPLTCSAYIRDTATDQTMKIPTPPGTARYAPVVHEAQDMVYFARSGRTCGSVVRIMRLPVSDLGARPVGLVNLPAGSTWTSRSLSTRWVPMSTSGSRGTAAVRSRATSTGSAASGSVDRQARSSGFVRQVGPPSPFREISSPT